MAAAEPTAAPPSSPLDKPLRSLTEDDISQVTREDCRRYLKSKGMRRPSWNKSQAIQQVISLKTLLETTSDSDAADEGPAFPLRKLLLPPPENTHRAPTTPAKAAAASSLSHRRNDPETTGFSGDSSGRLPAADNDSISPRNMNTTNVPRGQMTIFYGGKVNVYDDMPIDKARAVMQLAASPLNFSQDPPSDAVPTCWAFPCQPQAASARTAPSSPIFSFPPLQTVKTTENNSFSREENVTFREDSHEVPTSRKASVQRYLEKRKDRFKSKRKVATPSSGTLDIYLNHQIGDQIPLEQSNRNDACSPSQPRPPQTPTRCSSAENIAKHGSPDCNLVDKGV